MTEHKDWIRELRLYFESRTIPLHKTKQTYIESHEYDDERYEQVSLNTTTSIDSFEDTVFRSVNFEQEWLKIHPPLLRRQNAFRVKVDDV